MKGSKAPKEHNYLRKLRYLYKLGAIPHGVGVHMIEVYHDGWCGIYQDCSGSLL